MNLIRLIKLKIIDGELDNNLSKAEIYFLSFFKDLYIVENHYLNKRNSTYFYYDKNKNTLYCSYYNVFSKFYFEYDMTQSQILLMIQRLLKCKLNMDYKVDILF